MKNWLKKWIMRFVDEHGTRLFYLSLAVIGAAIIYRTIPDTLAEVKPIFYIAIGTCLNKARSPKAPDVTGGNSENPS
jgi:hypothetical protein